MKYALFASACLFGVDALAADASNVDKQREALVVQARAGSFVKAEQGLMDLYLATKDVKVRDDLITVMLNAGHQSALMAFCETCVIQEVSNDALESLARAARDVKQYQKAENYYLVLKQRSALNKNAWLGLMLSSIETRHFTKAQEWGYGYQATFGVDVHLNEARAYLERNRAASASSIGSLGTAIQRAESMPAPMPKVSNENALSIYKAANGLKALPVQPMVDLIKTNPDAFTTSDRLWLDEGRAVSLIKSGLQTENHSHWHSALTILNGVLKGLSADHPLYAKASFDKLQLLGLLQQNQAALEVAAELESKKIAFPLYAQEAKADALFGIGRAGHAIKIYERLFKENSSSALRQKLIMAYTDAKRYSDAQALLDGWSEKLSVLDFTQTYQKGNGLYEQRVYWKIKLKAWRGDFVGAQAILNEWMALAPANPWAKIINGDLQRWRGKPNKAIAAYQSALEWMSPSLKYHAQVGIVNAALDKGDVRTARRLLEKMPNNQANVSQLLERIKKESAAELSIGASSEQTGGASANVQSASEHSYDVKWLSRKNKDGHRVFVHYQTQTSDYGTTSSTASFAGLGARFNWHPWTLEVEAGGGLHLNTKPYLLAHAGYRVNDNWQLSAAAEYNSLSTPLKAYLTDHHGNSLGFAAGYQNGFGLTSGVSVNALKINDGNLRTGVAAWLKQDVIRRDRWLLNVGLYAGANHNRSVKADYYNPLRDSSAEVNALLSYRMPIDGRRSMTQTVTGSIGRYAQNDQTTQTTWRIDYRHHWKLNSGLGLDYGVSRKKMVYDGRPEYKTAVDANIQYRF